MKQINAIFNNIFNNVIDSVELSVDNMPTVLESSMLHRPDISIGSPVSHSLLPTGGIVKKIKGDTVSVLSNKDGRIYNFVIWSLKTLEPIREGVMGDIYSIIDKSIGEYVDQGVKYDILHPMCLKVAQEISSKYGITPEEAGHLVFQYVTDNHEDEGQTMHEAGFPYNVDHMNGSIIRNADMATDNVEYTTLKDWVRSVNSINSRVFNDDAEYISNSSTKKAEANSVVFAIWDNATQSGWVNIKGRKVRPITKEGSMGGINRARPANDVSHEKDLDPETPDKESELAASIEADKSDIEADNIY